MSKQKQEQLRDYNNYDYLFATVKKQNFNELKAHYKALGWEDIEEREDESYYDVVHISLRRPHKIKHKDDLQLMQVHLESAWNTIGKYSRWHCPKAAAFGTVFGVISLALIMIGLLSALGILKFLIPVYGYMITVLGGIVAIATVVISAVICSKERKSARLKRLTAEEEIAAVCERAEQLLHNNGVSGQPAGNVVEELTEAPCE